MKLEGTIHCEAPDCDIHQHVGASTMAANRLPVGWMRVYEYSNGDDQTWHAFCNGDCLMKWAAAWSAPPEAVGDFDGNPA